MKVKMSDRLRDLSKRKSILSRINSAVKLIEKNGGTVSHLHLREYQEELTQDLSNTVSAMSPHEIMENARHIARIYSR